MRSVWEGFKEYFWETVLIVLAIFNFGVFIVSDGQDELVALISYFGLLIIAGQCLVRRHIDALRDSLASRPVHVHLNDKDSEYFRKTLSENIKRSNL